MIEAEIHALQTALLQCLGDGVLPPLGTVQQQEAAPARSRNFARGRPVLQGQAIALIDETGREVWGETAFLLPGIVEQARELIQVAPFKARLHLHGYLLDMV